MLKELNDKKLFFKYCPINTKTKESLRKHQLYFSSPGKFNDPFDSKPNILFKGTKEEWNNYLAINKVNRTVDDLLKNGFLIRKGNYLSLKKERINRISGFNIESPLRICCFSKVYKNILMWSHYAKSHEGICLCFKSEVFSDNSGYYLSLDSEKCAFLPVDYNINMPSQVNMLHIGEWQKLSKFVITKHTDWINEEEHRIVVHKASLNDESVRNFPKECLVGIIFGLNVKREGAEEIYQIIRDEYHQEGKKVKFYRSTAVSGKYTIYIKMIESMDRFLSTLPTELKNQ